MKSVSRFRLIAMIVIASGALVAPIAFPLAAPGGGEVSLAPGPVVVFGYNELGMHCMNEDFSQLAILPPFNTLRATVVKRGVSPDIITSASDATVTYFVPTNTHSTSKCNFWTYADELFGVSLPPDVGLTGNGMQGSMTLQPNGMWQATGIPITPTDDTGRLNPYPLAIVKVVMENGDTATTQPVVPVSTEISCNLCHGGNGVPVMTDILQDHDTLHGTSLVNSTPVLCASCHADPALGTPGQPGVPNLSSAMHLTHAAHMSMIKLDNSCYACHPGVRTQCQRDIHLSQGVQCIACHGGMEAVGDPKRVPWVDLPRCGDCHNRPGFQFEQPGVLFKDSIGHGGMHCAACHGPPHAITPTTTAADNQQAIALQGHAGVIDTCIVCHTVQPKEPFFHSVEK